MANASSTLLSIVDLKAATIRELVALYGFCRSGASALDESLQQNRGSNALARLRGDFDAAIVSVFQALQLREFATSEEAELRSSVFVDYASLTGADAMDLLRSAGSGNAARRDGGSTPDSH